MIGNFEDKGIFTIKQNSQESIMHYVKSNGKYYSLTLSGNDKIDNFEIDPSIKLVFMKNKNESINANIKIIKDYKTTEDLYNRMKEIKFCYFKEYSKELVVLEVTK